MPDVRPVTYARDELTSIAGTLQRIARSQEALAHALTTIATTVPAAEPVAATHLYSRRDAARILARSTRTIDRRVRSGDLSVVRRDGAVLITGSSLRTLRHEDRSAAVEVLKL